MEMTRRRMNLNILLKLQILYGCLSLAFLFTSGWYARTTGEALSAAPVAPSAVMFLVYLGCLLIPKYGKTGWYRAMMALAIVPFGIGGVLMNILNYVQNGLRDYSSFGVFCIAVGINLFGTIWNIAAVAGLFEKSENA